jgi:hypothetical protein
MLYRKYIFPSASILLIVLLAIAFGAMRAMGALGPSTLRWLLPLGFCLMTLLPWILLTADGRKQIGLKKANKNSVYILAIACSALASITCFLLGYFIYGHSVENWYVNIGNSYKAIIDTSTMSFLMLNLIFTIPAILFSPIGEEIFFRGVLQKTMEQKLSVSISTIIECGLFALVHLCHHGILKTAGGLVFMPIPATLWVIQMFFVAFMFSWLRAKSGSIFVAIVAHSVFNLTMNLLIFMFLWK